MTATSYDFKIAAPVRGGRWSSSKTYAVSYKSAAIFHIRTSTSLHSASYSLFLDYNKSISAKKSFLDRLDKLYLDLKQDWDGYDGSPMEKKAYENTRDAINSMPAAILVDWNLYPCPNGTFMLTTKKNSASINIGNKDFSYAAFLNEENQIKGISTFNHENFLTVISHISNILKHEA